MANKPNNPSLWSKAKSLAKQKFDVYPSAYANGWAAKWYKSKGGTWRKAQEGMQIPYLDPNLMQVGGLFPRFMQDGGEPDGEMALGQMAAVIDKLSKLREFIGEDSDLEPWVSSKLAVMDHYADAVHDYMMYGPEAGDEEEEEEDEELSEDEMEEMKNGGIPERYRKRGFTRVGAKRQSNRPGKKWMVLAKKGDKYKIVHGGYKGMQDYTQHRNKKRQKNFWNRMGGRNSGKATDPFSPLYWHKRFGTWEEGGEIPMYQGGGRLSESVGADAQKIGKCGLERGGDKYKPDVLVEVPATKQELYPTRYKTLYSAMPSDKKERRAVMEAFEALRSAGTSPYLKDYTPEDYQAALYEANIYNNNMRQSGYEKYFDPTTGMVLPEYATSFTNPTMAFYRSKFPQSKQITAEQIINLMPLAERKAIIARGYKKYGGMSSYQNGGHYNLDGEWVKSVGSGTNSGNAYYQTGGQTMTQQPNNQQNEVMQIVELYAELAQVNPEEVIKELQQLQPADQQKAIQQMVQAIKSVQSSGNQQSMMGMQQPMMRGGGNMPCYQCGGMYAYGGMTDEMGGVVLPAMPVDFYGLPTYAGGGAAAYLNPYTDAMMEMQDGGKPEWLIRAQLKAQGYNGSALENKLAQMKRGGIHINPKNKGKFTAKAKAAGMGVQAFANKVLGAPEGQYSGATRKQANFARVFGGRNYQVGGEYQMSAQEIQDLINQGYNIEYLD